MEMIKMERYVIVTNGTEVTVIDTEEDNGVLFGLECDDEESAIYLKRELEPLVRIMNDPD